MDNLGQLFAGLQYIESPLSRSLLFLLLLQLQQRQQQQQQQPFQSFTSALPSVNKTRWESLHTMEREYEFGH